MVEECWKKRRQDKIILIRMEEIIKHVINKMVEECWKKKRRQDKIVLIRMEEIIKHITK